MRDILIGFLLAHALFWVWYSMRGSLIVCYITQRTRHSALANAGALAIAVLSVSAAVLISL